MSNLAALLQDQLQQRGAVSFGRECNADLIKPVDFAMGALDLPFKPRLASSQQEIVKRAFNEPSQRIDFDRHVQESEDRNPGGCRRQSSFRPEKIKNPQPLASAEGAQVIPNHRLAFNDGYGVGIGSDYILGKWQDLPIRFRFRQRGPQLFALAIDAQV